MFFLVYMFSLQIQIVNCCQIVMLRLCILSFFCDELDIKSSASVSVKMLSKTSLLFSLMIFEPSILVISKILRPLLLPSLAGLGDHSRGFHERL